MGFKIKAPKIKAPKIKLQPAKLVNSAVQSMAVLPKAAISTTADVAGTAVAGAGKVLSQPGAGAVLGAAGAAFGIPGAGLLASALTGPANSSMSPAPAPVWESSVPTAVHDSGQNGFSSNAMMIAGAASIGLILVVVLFLSGRGKR